MKINKRLPEYLPNITIDLATDPKRIIFKPEEGRSYHSISVDISRYSKETFHTKFISIFFPPTNTSVDDIETRKTLIVNKTIADIFYDFVKKAIYKPHDGKKVWLKEKALIISRLDPMRKFYVWEILDKVYEKI